MEKILERTLLYDFYGELLTKHQREVYEDVVLGDLGYSEAAEEYGITRQGVHDLVRRAESQLNKYESMLHLVERFLKIRQEIARVKAISDGSDITKAKQGSISEICDRILNEL